MSTLAEFPTTMLCRNGLVNSEIDGGSRALGSDFGRVLGLSFVVVRGLCSTVGESRQEN